MGGLAKRCALFAGSDSSPIVCDQIKINMNGVQLFRGGIDVSSGFVAIVQLLKVNPIKAAIKWHQQASRDNFSSQFGSQIKFRVGVACGQLNTPGIRCNDFSRNFLDLQLGQVLESEMLKRILNTSLYDS